MNQQIQSTLSNQRSEIRKELLPISKCWFSLKSSLKMCPPWVTATYIWCCDKEHESRSLWRHWLERPSPLKQKFKIKQASYQINSNLFSRENYSKMNAPWVTATMRKSQHYILFCDWEEDANFRQNANWENHHVRSWTQWYNRQCKVENSR